MAISSRPFLRPGNRRLLALLLATSILGASLLWFGLTVSAKPIGSRADQVALTYAQQYMLWHAGPQVHSTRVIPLGDLQGALASAPPTLRKDLNVPSLVRQYGSHRRVALVLLSGIYNTLAPDEGIYLRGEVAVLVDTRSNHVLLLSD